MKEKSPKTEGEEPQKRKGGSPKTEGEEPQKLRERSPKNQNRRAPESEGEEPQENALGRGGGGRRSARGGTGTAPRPRQGDSGAARAASSDLQPGGAEGDGASASPVPPSFLHLASASSPCVRRSLPRHTIVSASLSLPNKDGVCF